MTPADLFPLSGAAALPPAEEESGAPEQERGFSICAVCHGPSRHGCSLCWSCRFVRLGLGARPIPPVVPMALVAQGTGAHRALVAYKAARSTDCRRRAARSLAGLAGPWLKRHLGCCAAPPRCERDSGGSGAGACAGSSGPGRLGVRPLLVVPVPSTTGGRPSWGGRHPLELLVERLLDDTSRAAATMCRALEASRTPPTRLVPRPDGFVSVASLGGQRCIVLDDLFVSGSRALSAAAALEDAGATVQAVVTLARFVRPEHNLATARYWEAFGRLPVDLSRCVLCGPATRQSRVGPSIERAAPAWRRTATTVARAPKGDATRAA